MLECYTCRRKVALVRRVKLRGDVMSKPWRGGPPLSGPWDPRYKAYEEECTYRWAIVCLGCYAELDSFDGRAEIDGRVYNIAGASRGGRAAVYDEVKYSKRQRRYDDRLGLPEL